MIDQFDIGYPKRFGSCHIGLYQPILNRFLLTLCNVEYAREIAMIASGRYHLFLVNLVTADNYSENLIDNLCCDNWSLPAEQITETTINRYANFIVDATHLTENYNTNELVEEKQYLQLCWQYLKLIDSVFANNVNGPRIKQFLLEVFELPDHKYTIVQNLKKQILAELFLGLDTNSVRNSVEGILAKAKEDHDLVF